MNSNGHALSYKVADLVEIYIFGMDFTSILTNSSLSSMPIYMMSLFLLHEGTHQQMGTVRSKLFCGTDKEKFKGKHVSTKGLLGGIVNTRVLNESLILKLVWKLYNHEEEDMCCALLQQKYLKNNPLATCKYRGGHIFGRVWIKSRTNSSGGCFQFSVNSGKNVLFGENVWVGVPLKLSYPNLDEQIQAMLGERLLGHGDGWWTSKNHCLQVIKQCNGNHCWWQSKTSRLMSCGTRWNWP